MIVVIVGAWMLGPRIRRYEHGPAHLPMKNPTKPVRDYFCYGGAGWTSFIYIVLSILESWSSRSVDARSSFREI